MTDILKFLGTDYEIDANWIDLFSHFIMLDNHKKMPSKTWYKQLDLLVRKIGEGDFINVGMQWVDDCIKKSRENRDRFARLGIVSANEAIHENLGFQHRKIPEWVLEIYGDDILDYGFIRMGNYAYLNDFKNYFYQSLGGRILRGFMHAVLVLENERLLNLVDKMAIANPDSSQDAIHIYSKLPKDISIPKLAYLRAKAKNKFVLARIEKAISAIGKIEGLSKLEIEESIIPDFDIVDGQYILIIDEIQAVFEIQNIKTYSTYFILPNGKVQKAVPKVLKENFPVEIKLFKVNCKEIKKSLTNQKNRIESFFLINRTIDFSAFSKYYINNQLVRIIAKDLIWTFKKDNFIEHLVLLDNNFVDVEGNIYQGDLSDCIVSLWHPIGLQAKNVLQWRNMMMQNEILQSFKQAYREVYILTDAEIKTTHYSNRFASHILNKDQVAGLCKVRRWSPSGIIDKGRITFKVPDSDINVEFRVGDIYLGEDSRLYGSAHISTDQIRFYNKKSPIDLIDVPAFIFSEVLRDVDLFVGVTSIGNDPSWNDHGDEHVYSYWSKYSNGELTERSNVRVDILKQIIPKMKISKVCNFEGKYIKVKGKIRNYKIHMGSGNILMEPNDQYLCIVAGRKSASLNKMFIPFDGDNMLSIIISKAILLAGDDKIKDESIVSQINRI